jgi:hypothetical protein
MHSDIELPKFVTLKFVDPDRELDTNLVESPRLIGGSEGTQSFDIPLVMSASEAKKAVDDLGVEFWRQRLTFKFSLPIKYLGLDAGDVFHVKRAGNALSERWRVRRVSLRADGVIEGEAQPHIFHWAQGSPSPGDAGSSSVLAQVVPSLSNTVMQLFDVPLLSDNVPDSNGFYAMGHSDDTGNVFTGWVLYRSVDGGTTYNSLDNFTAGAVAGSCRTSLAMGPTNYPDTKNTVQVNFGSTGVPTTITNADMQRADNAVLCGAAGRWEVMQFRDATLVSGTVYDLSYLTRGLAGTEHHAGSHVTGDKFFILTDTATKRVGQELNYLNVALPYKGVTAFQAVASVASQGFVNTGECMKPWSGVYGSAVRSGNDWDIVWARRNRQFGGWNNGGDVPMTEVSEHYEADVKTVAGSVVRTIAVSAPSITYTQAQQNTDFGGVQASVTLDVFQMSQRVGRGNILTIKGQV